VKDPTPAGGPGPLLRNLLTVALFTVLVVAFTWPLARDPLAHHLSRQFDWYGAAWLSGVAPLVDGRLDTAMTNWPFGESLVQADSFVLLAMSHLLTPVTGPMLPLALCALGGPVLSAWAAERFAARALGASWPASLIAGAAYGFSGLAATALLEGHVYLLLNPWLPLFAWHALVATRRTGRAGDAVLAGIYWGLCLLTSAYAGIAATLFVVVVGIAALVRRSLHAAPAVAFLAIILPLGVAYGAVFDANGGALDGRPLPASLAYTFDEAGDSDAASVALADLDPGDLDPGDTAAHVAMNVGSTHLLTLVGWTPSVDAYRHSIAPSLGFTVILLSVVGLRALRGTPGWKAVGVAGLLALLLSFGPYLQLLGDDLRIPWLLWPLDRVAASTFFRFPGRLMMLASLALGGVAALTASRVFAGRRGPVLAVVLLAALEPLVQTALPARAAVVPVDTPAAYFDAPDEGAVLDFLPVFDTLAADQAHYWNNLTCSYQADHLRPILNRCLGTVPEEGSRVLVSTWLAQGLRQRAPDLARVLADIGISSVAFHPDAFPEGSRATFRDALDRSFGIPASTSDNGGERVLLYLLPRGTTTPRQQVDAYKRLRSSLLETAQTE